MIVGRAIIRDRFQGPQAQRMLATVSLIFGIAPALAPIIGGWLVGPIGWRGIFAALDAAAMLLWWVCWKTLPETHPRARRGRFSTRALLRIYREVVRDRQFVALAAAAALNFGALFVYVASAPALILRILHLNERQFAWLFIQLIAGMMIGSVLVNRLSERLRTEIIVRSGYVVVALGSLVNLALSSGWIAPQVPWAVLPFTALGAGVALAFPALTLLMLDRFPLNRGAAASMQAMTSLSLNALIAGALSPLVSASLLTLALAATLFTTASFACWLWVHNRLQVTGVMAPVAAHPSGVAPAADV
jgi:DHA1 family bicyclomycin/chloramphenicol resistance-like MFS transporter